MSKPRGSFRWFGLTAFVVGLWIYADGSGNTYSEWWVGRWGMVIALFGGVTYLEGLAVKVVSAVDRRSRVDPGTTIPNIP